MSFPTTIQGDLTVTGNLSPKTMQPVASSVNAASIVASAVLAGLNLQGVCRHTYSQPNTTATTETRIIHRVYGATATIQGVYVGSIGVAVGAATVTLDLKKNGTTVLTGVVTLNSSNTTYVAVSGTLGGSANGVAGDVYTIVLTATASGGTLPTGVFVELAVIEDPQ